MYQTIKLILTKIRTFHGPRTQYIYQNEKQGLFQDIGIMLWSPDISKSAPSRFKPQPLARRGANSGLLPLLNQGHKPSFLGPLPQLLSRKHSLSLCLDCSLPLLFLPPGFSQVLLVLCETFHTGCSHGFVRHQICGCYFSGLEARPYNGNSFIVANCHWSPVTSDYVIHDIERPLHQRSTECGEQCLH